MFSKKHFLVICILTGSYLVKGQSHDAEFGYLDKGDSIEFVFWVEPPADAVNRYTGRDGYTNLTLKL